MGLKHKKLQKAANKATKMKGKKISAKVIAVKGKAKEIKSAPAKKTTPAKQAPVKKKKPSRISFPSAPLPIIIDEFPADVQ